MAGLSADPDVENGLQPDFPRPPVPSGEGEALDFTIDPAIRGKLVELCRELGVTEFMVLQAAVAIALHKSGQGTDIALGTPVAGRTAPELDGLIGFFINIVVLRNDLSAEPDTARGAAPFPRYGAGRLQASGPAVRPRCRRGEPGAFAGAQPAVRRGGARA